LYVGGLFSDCFALYCMADKYELEESDMHLALKDGCSMPVSLSNGY